MKIGCQVYVKDSASAVELYLKAFGAKPHTLIGQLAGFDNTRLRGA